jgi:hypothetical protein
MSFAEGRGERHDLPSRDNSYVWAGVGADRAREPRERRVARARWEIAP